MKKTLLTLAFLAVAFINVFAQVPNGNFELWTSNSNNVEYPDGWLTANAYDYTTEELATASKVAGVTGSALKITTKGIPIANLPILGIAISATLDTVPGFPFSEKPTVFSGSYKYEISAEDTAAIILALSKYNPTTKKRDSIGGAIFRTGTAQTTFNTFAVPVQYFEGAGNPDTATVLIISSSSKKPVIGSAITVDNLSTTGVTGVTTSLFPNFSKAYPNPSSNFMTLSDVPANAVKVEVRDQSGKVVESIPATSVVSLNVANLASGLYYYSVKDNTETTLYSEKISVVK